MISVSDFDRFVFIVGAPRCGTTSLAQFLKEHPTVGFPAVKEPHYFAQNDLRGLSDRQLRCRVESDYLRRFYRPETSRRIGVDASVTYLYTPEQLEPVLRLWPESRFVVAVRDPLTMLPSLHRRLIYIGDETIPAFKDAWAAVSDRAAGRRIPRRCVDPRWLRYDQAARFATYLRRLFAVVGRERCFVILFDDLAKDLAEQYRRLMEFAGMEAVPRTDFAVRREGKSVRFGWLQRLLKRPPNAVREYLAGEHFRQRVRNLDGKNSRAPNAVLSLRKRLLAWNRVSIPPEPLPTDLQVQLRRQLEGEVEHLGRILGRDLSHWLRPRGESPFGAVTDKSDRPIAEGRRNAFSH